MKPMNQSEEMEAEHANRESASRWKYTLLWGIEYREVPVGLVFVIGWAVGYVIGGI